MAAALGAVRGARLCASLSPQQFFRSYLVAYLFWFGIGLGSMAILMIHHIAGGAWGAVIRRLLECATRTLPLMALLFLPLVFGMHSLYEWARPEVVAHDPLLQHKSAVPERPVLPGARRVLLRGVADASPRCSIAGRCSRTAATIRGLTRRLELLSRGGLVAIGLTMTFASVDWVMSLEPHWYSTIYGILIIGGQVLKAMAFVIPLAALLVARRTARRRHRRPSSSTTSASCCWRS